MLNELFLITIVPVTGVSSTCLFAGVCVYLCVFMFICLWVCSCEIVRGYDFLMGFVSGLTNDVWTQPVRGALPECHLQSGKIMQKQTFASFN